MVILIVILAAIVGYLYTQLEEDNVDDTTATIDEPLVPTVTPPDPSGGDVTPVTPTPSNPQPLEPKCSIEGWNASTYNIQEHIVKPDVYDGLAGVILNRSATESEPYSATGAASVNIACDVEFSLVSHPSAGTYSVIWSQLSPSLVRITPPVDAPVYYRTPIRLMAQGGGYVDLEVYVHDGDIYSHFAISPRFGADEDIFTSTQTQERIDSYLVPFLLSGELTRHVLCIPVTGTEGDLCYIVNSDLRDNAIPPNVRADPNTIGYIGPVSRHIGEVYSYFSGAANQFRTELAPGEGGYVYAGSSTTAMSGSIAVSGISDKCIEFQSSNLIIGSSAIRDWMIRWCEDGAGGGFIVDSVTPVSGAHGGGPVVQTALIEEVNRWSAGKVPLITTNLLSLTSLPQEYELERFLTVDSQFTIPTIPSNLRGIALVCTSSDAPTIVNNPYFVISPSGSTDTTLPPFYWLFFTGDVRNVDQASTKLRCGTKEVSVSVAR